MTARSRPAEPPAHVVAGPPDLAQPRRPRLWTEVLVVVGLCWVYDAVNNLARLRRGQAFTHAYSVLRLEQRVHLAPELALNRWLGHERWIGLILSDYYDLLHFAVTFGVLGWLWWRHPGRYRGLRNALIAVNVIGFAVFWLYPLAPPRMLRSAGFVDVVAVRHAVGAWSSGALATKANEFAAMPSLHMAWAVWSGVVVWRMTRRRSLRVGACAYPVVTAAIVVATANHYVVDVVAGVVTAAVAIFATAPRRRGQPRSGRGAVVAGLPEPASSWSAST